MSTDPDVVPAGPAEAEAAEDAAPAPARSGRARRGWVIGTILGIVAFLALGVGGGIVVARLAGEARAQQLAERAVSQEQSAAISAALAASADTVAQIDAQRAAYDAAATLWSDAEASAAAFQAENTVPTVSAPNPGGGSLPGGDEQARALLDGIGGQDVQIVYDGGDQNCGFAAADELYALALGGCYDSRFRDSVFLAWDSGATRDDIWPIFVHEAMHWYQWDRLATIFAAAERSGIDREDYRAQIESDASCRAVIEHGVPRSAYERSSAPCDVADWSDGWLQQQIAGLGVPTAAPDPETFEVQEVTRP